MHSKSAPRRQHSAELKAKVLAACEEPGASISAVALAHGLNANLVRQWREGRGLKRVGLVAPTSPRVVTPTPLIADDARFVPIDVAVSAEPARANHPERVDLAAVTPSVIQIELRRGSLHLNVRWPSAAAGDCMAWLRELSAGPSK
jgi:transposase